MRSAGSSSSLSAFARSDSGCDYLATTEHYQYLAKRIVEALHCGCLALVTGEPPADLPMLATALRELSAPRPVIEMACGPEFNWAQLFFDGSESPDAPAPVATGQDAGSSAPAPPIYLLTDADRLSDDQIEESYEAAQAISLGPDGFAAAVLLAHSDFVTRAEVVASDLVDEGLAAHLRVQQLDRDEVETFIRRQLPTGEGANLFTAEQMALISLTSGGDPAEVNRCARRLLGIERDVSPPPRPPPRRYGVLLRLPAGIVICLGAAWLVAGGAFERPDLGAVVGQVRDRLLLPRNEASGASSRAGVPAPAAGPSSPAFNLAVTFPDAASADRAAPELGAVAERPGGDSLSAPTPEPARRPAADGQPLSAPEIAALVARGDAFIAAGDIASARLLFERAAELRDGRAALRLAVTYDAAFLERAGIYGLPSDPEQAAFWYRRARELGAGKPEPPPGSPGPSSPAQPLPR
jgi:hypothetical protein